MTFLRVQLISNVIVKYQFSGAIHQPTWTFEWPGSYAPGLEHTAKETLPVVSVAFTLHRPEQDAPWEVKGTVIECANTPRDNSTVLMTVQPDAAIPRWLADLTERARRAASL